MISSEVQRTLVKSPPELWTELSDPASLGRHLGEFGEIRITRVEPEKTVEWEAENTSGTVLIKPSGWGTRVTLKATRGMPAPEPAATPEPPAASEPPAEPEPEPDTTARQAAESETEQAGAEPEPAVEAESDSEPAGELEQAAEAQPDAAAEAAEREEIELEYQPQPDAEQRRGFFARLFSWRRGEKPTDLASPAPAEPPQADVQQPEPPQTDIPQSDSPQPDAAQADAPVADAAQPESSQPDAAHVAQQDSAPPAEPDISAELEAAEEVATEEVAAEEVTAVLTSMLDRLGTAHHRPFSRS
jgi:hypothetical protein